jgi:hypothetical protein
MADFYGCLETTSFRVKDRASFLADAEVQHIANHARAEGFFEQDGETFSFGWYGQYPSTVLVNYDVNGDEEEEVSICEVIQRHILPGDVCQIGISGNEKLRYVGGDIQWVTSQGVVTFGGVTEWTNRMSEKDLLALVDDFAQQVRTVLPFNPRENNQ